MKSTTATPNTAASFGPYFDPEAEALLVDVDVEARSSLGGLVMSAVEEEKRAVGPADADDEVVWEDLQGSSLGP